MTPKEMADRYCDFMGWRSNEDGWRIDDSSYRNLIAWFETFPWAGEIVIALGTHNLQTDHSTWNVDLNIKGGARFYIPSLGEFSDGNTRWIGPFKTKEQLLDFLVTTKISAANGEK